MQNGAYDAPDGKTADNHFNPGGHPLVIGNEVTVGDGAIIRSQVMVAAGSLVLSGKDLDSDFLWIGSPVKRMHVLKDSELEYLFFSAQHYVDLKNNHMATGS